MTINEEGNGKNTADAAGGVKVDVMSPYFISSSDTPNTVFVSDLLNEGNYAQGRLWVNGPDYADWAEEISNALFAKNKIGFVDGTIQCPPEGLAEFGLWKRCNAMVKGWLHSSMEKDIRSSVKHAKTAQEVWADLGERFKTQSAPRTYELKREITLTRQEKLSVSSYYTKLKGLWDEINSISPMPKCKCNGCTCDVPKQLMEMREKERLYEFLMGLDESFGTVKTQILSTKPMLSLGVAYHLVSEDERQRQITTTGRPSIEAAAFQTQGMQKPNKDFKKDGLREKPKCTHCGKYYHTVESCYELVGYPNNKKKGGDSHGKSKNPGKSAYLADADDSPIPGLSAANFNKLVHFFNKQPGSENPPTANMAGKMHNTTSWIIDSGASEHITCDVIYVTPVLFKKINYYI
ncbi:hypothetical protein OROMI_015768 [Orobanche minor]